MQDLVERLTEHEKESFCNAFLVTKSIIDASKDEIEQNVKEAFEHTIKQEGLEMRRERGELYVGSLPKLNSAKPVRFVLAIPGLNNSF